MSVKYGPVGWNRNKLIYDFVLLAAVVVYILIYLRVAPSFADQTRPLSGAILRMQAFGSCAFVMLTLIVCIGPLARLDTRFLLLLYNRRHFGVLTCTVAFVHASYVLGLYFAFSPTDPFVALLSSNSSFGQVIGFPFELFGIAALTLLTVLAVTSHDFWLSFLTPPVWKAIHMSVYVAYVAVVIHIALGYLQAATNPVFAMVVMASAVTVSALHFAAACKTRSTDAAERLDGGGADWLDAGDMGDIEDGCAIVVATPLGERVAIFRNGAILSAISNVCAHQNGPLGEGRVIDDCVTCPWHGFQYRLVDGCAPPPFTEKIATYQLRLEGRRVMLDPRSNPPGTPVEPIVIAEL